jgi:GNAT superfamily N-acetyltransferase
LNRKTTYTLRDAGEPDFTWLRQLHHAAMRESVEQVWGWNDAWQDAFFRAHFDPGRLKIIQCEGRDVGVLDVEERTEGVFLADIQIDPAAQGRGIGSAVIHDLQARAAAQRAPLTLQINRAINRANSQRIHHQMNDTELRQRPLVHRISLPRPALRPIPFAVANAKTPSRTGRLRLITFPVVLY